MLWFRKRGGSLTIRFTRRARRSLLFFTVRFVNGTQTSYRDMSEASRVLIDCSRSALCSPEGKNVRGNTSQAAVTCWCLSCWPRGSCRCTAREQQQWTCWRSEWHRGGYWAWDSGWSWRFGLFFCVSLFCLIKDFPAVFPRALRSNEQLILVKKALKMNSANYYL